MSAEAITEIAGAEGNTALACLAELLGDSFIDELAAAIMACLDEGAVKALIVDCLTNPDTSPITKSYLAEIFQGEDLDDDGVLGVVTESEEPGAFVTTSAGIKIQTVKGYQLANREIVKG